KRGPMTIVRAGIVVQLAGVLTAAAVLSTDIGWTTLAIALSLFGVGAGMASSQLTSLILAEVPRDRARAASGVATTNNPIGAALGVAILGAVLRLGTFRDAGSARWALFVAAALLAAGSATSFAIPAGRPATTDQPEPAVRPPLSRPPPPDATP